MNYYLMAIVLITLIFVIVIVNLIFKIHELYVKIEELNKNSCESIGIIRDNIIRINTKIEATATYIDYAIERFNETDQYIRNELMDELNTIDQYIRKEVKDELNAIGRTTTEQADIMLKIEERINELERTDEKEGDVIESERISEACVEN